ncbi:MAG TPA: hypothetical protein VMX17_03725 [Candidatus Glassbacteria bacterium]|nr:hypothetical protein [Candidatus Glassbacteria bacterium]
MAKIIESIEMLKEYFNEVIERANHHAPNVSKITYTLLGLIIFKKDKNSAIEVRSYEGATGNILWVTINNTRYAFRYEHTDDTIEIRKDTFKGELIYKVDNTTSMDELLNTFNNL